MLEGQNDAQLGSQSNAFALDIVNLAWPGGVSASLKTQPLDSKILLLLPQINNYCSFGQEQLLIDIFSYA